MKADHNTSSASGSQCSWSDQ